MSEKTEIIELYKKVGETPLECIYSFKVACPEYADIKMTYLGRLDPMAEGLLLVLAGDTRSKPDFLSWDKTYEFEVLWGFKTDTYDILGLVEGSGAYPEKLDWKIPKLLQKIKAKKSQSYPPYSSRTVGGKSLFLWARENKIDEVDIPERGIKIFSIDHIHTRLATGKEILEDIKMRVELVKGDFRQKQIIKSWEKVLKTKLSDQFLISRFHADVSSGTYIRGLAHEMGHALGTGAIAFGIKRTRVGEYRLDSK